MQLAWDEEDSTQVAIKFVARGSAYLSRAAEREILNHRLLTGHAHIVQFKEVQPLTFSTDLLFRRQQAGYKYIGHEGTCQWSPAL